MEKTSSGNRETRMRLPWALVGIFLILLAVLFFARNSASIQNQTRVERAAYDRLESIAILKSDQISAWLSAHDNTAHILSSSRVISDEIWAFIQNPENAAARDNLLEWMSSVRDTYDYSQVRLASTEGEILAATPANTSPLVEETRRALMSAVSVKDVIPSDLYQGEDGRMAMDYFAPVILVTEGGKQSVAVLILSIDPAISLFPLVNSWPNPTSSSEVLLVRPEGQQVALLNQPELAAGGLVNGTLPANQDDLITSQAVLQGSGTASGLDYRGEPVLASFRHVPGSDWIVMAKVDRREVIVPVQEQDFLVSLMTVTIFISAMLAAVLITRQREGKYYKEMYWAEVRRQALSERLSFLSKYANDIILLTDENWKILEANDRALTAYGYSLEQLKQKTFFELSDADARVDLIHQIQPLKSQSGLVFEAIQTHTDGKTFPVECSTRIIEVEGRQVYQSIIRDITERKQAEEMLVQSERRFRQFYEQAPICYQSLDSEGCFTDVNEAWLETFGYTRKDVSGRNFAEFLAPESKEHWLAAMRDFIHSGELRGCELEFLCARGERVIISVTGNVSYNEDHQVRNLRCVLDDVTEQRLAASQIQQMNEELEKRVLDRTAQLEAANKELEAFSYSVSHDLRAPLRAIDGFTRIVLEDYAAAMPEGGSRYLSLVRDNAHTMSSLIDNLLTFSRLNRHALARQQIDMNEMVDQALQTLTAGQECRQISFIINALPGCKADPLLIKQVYINLLSNAIKFTGKVAAAIVEVGCLQENHENIYYVKDNGVGFDMQYAPKLFGVFQRLHRVEDYEGTGVGLAIVQRIIHRHGGRIWAMGEINQGATFCFTLEESNHHE
jgi:PAS domain S-box-containing protein